MCMHTCVYALRLSVCIVVKCVHVCECEGTPVCGVPVCMHTLNVSV